MCKINVYKYLQKDFPSTVHDIEKKKQPQVDVFKYGYSLQTKLCIQSPRGKKNYTKTREWMSERSVITMDECF